MLKEKEGMVPAIVLTVICIVTALLLALTNSITSKKIAAAELAAATEQMKTLFTEASSFENIDKIKLTAVTKEVEGLTNAFLAKKDGEDLGYVFFTESKGYGGMLPIMTAITKDGSIAGVSIMQNNETPGLGKRVENPDFTDQFKDKSAEKKFAIKDPKEDEQQLDALSGATVSSASVKESLNKAIDAFNKLK